MSSFPKDWVLATGNAGKAAEITRLLAPADIRIRRQLEFGISGAPETAETFVENALLKARHAARESGLPALADDSGLCVDALGGAPGLVSARYAGPGASDQDNIAKLLDALDGEGERGASFVCIIVALLAPQDPAPFIGVGRWHGTIGYRSQGERGFGYDPIFIVRDGVTAAQLEATDKDRVSHRGRAAAMLLKELENTQQQH